ncbi:MAG TPA: hypothetical protein VKR31_07210, partial [Rhizomicrobium sp.]|nr:hypothetical protein [Rhizomicrobium sp.]
SGLWTKLEGRGAEVITGAIDDFNNLTGAIENATKALFGFDNEETTPPKPKPPPQIEDIEMTGDTVRRDADYARDLETFEQKERRKTEIAQQEARRREEIADEEARRQADEASESIADAERTLQAMQRADVQNVNDYIEEQNRRLSEGVSHLDREYQAHEISAQGKHGAEIALTEQIFAEDIKRLDAEIATLTPGTELWREEMKKRADLVAQYNAQIERSNDQLVSEEQQKWTQLGNSIRSSFNSAIDGMLFQGRSFEQGMFQIAEGVAEAFLQMAEKIAEDWIEQQITSMFETRATQGTTSLGQITDAAAVAAANTFASTAAIPVIGPELAPEAAAGAMAQVMG